MTRTKSSAAIIAADVSEAQFLATVIDIAQMLGWLVYHQRPAMTSKGYRTALQGDAGFPDLVLARLKSGAFFTRVIYAELKVGKNKPTTAQQKWLDVLSCISVGEVYIWTPSDMEQIKKALT